MIQHWSELSRRLLESNHYHILLGPSIRHSARGIVIFLQMEAWKVQECIFRDDKDQEVGDRISLQDTAAVSAQCGRVGRIEMTFDATSQ